MCSCRTQLCLLHPFAAASRRSASGITLLLLLRVRRELGTIKPTGICRKHTCRSGLRSDWDAACSSSLYHPFKQMHQRQSALRPTGCRLLSCLQLPGHLA
jgi:hypothetical protein